MDLALNNLQKLICRKTHKSNQTKPILERIERNTESFSFRRKVASKSLRTTEVQILLQLQLKVYNALFSVVINLRLKIYLGKIRTVFRKIDTQHHWFYESKERKLKAKNLEAILLFVDFFEKFDSIHIEKMEQVLLA